MRHILRLEALSPPRDSNESITHNYTEVVDVVMRLLPRDYALSGVSYIREIEHLKEEPNGPGP